MLVVEGVMLACPDMKCYLSYDISVRLDACGRRRYDCLPRYEMLSSYDISVRLDACGRRRYVSLPRNEMLFIIRH